MSDKIQNHRLAGPVNDAPRRFRADPDGFDGVAEAWFGTLDDLLAALGSPEARAAAADLIEDERTFIDHAKSPVLDRAGTGDRPSVTRGPDRGTARVRHHATDTGFSWSR
ncbi:MAG TPA: EthD domain-containing protein [Trebonia sp.]|nr:EthD domain-containing protein [Trebonia sp.]